MGEEATGEASEIPKISKSPRKTLISILLIAIVGVSAVSVFIWWYTQRAPEGEEEPVDLVWEKTYGGSDDDQAFEIVQCGDGGFIVVGNTYSLGAGGGDVYLLRIDGDGNKVWEKTYGGSESDLATSIVQCGEGEFIVAGTSQEDVNLLKIDGNGNRVWEKTYGGSGGDEAWCIVQCGDGEFIIAGWTASFDAEGDVYLLKIDGDGNKIWEKTYGGSEDDWGTCIVESEDGGFVIAGGTKSFGAGATNIYLLKIDADGNEVWEKTYGGDNKEEAYSIVECGDGGFIVGASTRSTFEDVYLLKIDGDGNKIWEKTYGGTTGSDYCYDVVQCGDGGFIVVGNTYSLGAGGGDVYLLKIDGDGEMIWQKAYGGSEYDEGSSIVECGGGEFIVAGTSHGDVYLLKIRVSN